MPFSSPVVSLSWFQNSIVLRRGETTIQILPEDSNTLRTMKDESMFIEYFRKTALKNREARRVFEAWERKDDKLLVKLHQEMTSV